MDIERVKGVLDGLYQKLGRSIVEEDILKEAKKKSSPLHLLFEWDDSKAGHQYRLLQARDLIRRIKIDVVVEDVQVSVAGWQRAPRTEETTIVGYMPTADIIKSPRLSSINLEYYLKMIRGQLLRCVPLAQTLGHQDAVENMVVEVDSILDGLRAVA